MLSVTRERDTWLVFGLACLRHGQIRLRQRDAPASGPEGEGRRLRADAAAYLAHGPPPAFAHLTAVPGCVPMRSARMTGASSEPRSSWSVLRAERASIPFAASRRPRASFPSGRPGWAPANSHGLSSGHLSSPCVPVAPRVRSRASRSPGPARAQCARSGWRRPRRRRRGRPCAAAPGVSASGRSKAAAARRRGRPRAASRRLQTAGRRRGGGRRRGCGPARGRAPDDVEARGEAPATRPPEEVPHPSPYRGSRQPELDVGLGAVLQAYPVVAQPGEERHCGPEETAHVLGRRSPRPLDPAPGSAGAATSGRRPRPPDGRRRTPSH